MRRVRLAKQAVSGWGVDVQLAEALFTTFRDRPLYVGPSELNFVARTGRELHIHTCSIVAGLRRTLLEQPGTKKPPALVLSFGTQKGFEFTVLHAAALLGNFNLLSLTNYFDLSVVLRKICRDMNYDRVAVFVPVPLIEEACEALQSLPTAVGRRMLVLLTNEQVWKGVSCAAVEVITYGSFYDHRPAECAQRRMQVASETDGASYASVYYARSNARGHAELVNTPFTPIIERKPDSAWGVTAFLNRDRTDPVRGPTAL
jgi:hypothetical protein